MSADAHFAVRNNPSLLVLAPRNDLMNALASQIELIGDCLKSRTIAVVELLNDESVTLRIRGATRAKRSPLPVREKSQLTGLLLSEMTLAIAVTHIRNPCAEFDVAKLSGFNMIARDAG